MNGTASRPLGVDLDGTLIRTDLLVESIFALLKRNVLFVFLLPLWLLKGRAHLKHEIAARVDIDVGLLPYQDDFLAYLKQAYADGRRLILVTAANERFAEAIALNLGIFHRIVASNATVNLSGRRKLERLQDLSGDGGFDYAANAMVDLPVWEQAGEALLVNPEPGVKAAVERRGKVTRVFEDRTGNPLKHYLKALRIHQWLKNLLVFVPLLLAHRFGDLVLVGQALLAFLAFGLCASSVYLLNDLLDLPDDRRHPTKRHRPFAAGTVSIVYGVMLIPGLLISAFGLALFLPLEFMGMLAFYYLITLAYSLRLKGVALVDVMVLAGLYVIRIIAGAAAVSVMLSFWLLAFSMFLFLSLALVKRFTELLTMQQQEGIAAFGRGYRTTDRETLSQFGSTSAYSAVLVLAFYINSEAMRDLYTHPEVIWLLCPLLLYLMTRIWLLARRGQLDEDPVVFVIRDRYSQWLVGIGALLLWLAV
ncbi:UbiA family prenyltransferase [Candidatus Thiosymbion oneisti]|uniref:UbiA family prenyltransferase n=1 Tax=Candidatus Thiosymbion oneisti TaxID=589554 RepID=UPI000AA7C82D|nr:UbiA family prenyltransferase [Candidatus Thiosymbion oneisti]